MRGSHLPRWQCVERRGIIPAHAGLTKSALNDAFIPGDHPRACGAHFASQAAFEAPKGSSPRMRGSREAPFSDRSVYGIIPAHAGLTVTT